ncbi:oxidoreductase [Longispora fulva]|uniref:Putative dehydrogenase n=1 Tax=Longispora fulva TaxID=619741 RepID=A0A8J7GBU8_9ACTN|nr:Gfo/Idh/MocA family oxidoreductase [Longispora fulva]MBG6137628.1 putative dehydrogenase [Longispora fulva]GIG62214.1 oxidoreductase [Longispora fulva]
MTRAYRIGLIGYGLAGSAFHAPLIATTPGLELASVLTNNPERVSRVRRQHPGARIVGSIEDLFALDLDLVVVASPNRTHVPYAAAALGLGLGVVVDKPLAGTSAEALELVELAEERGLLLTVYQNRRWDGDFLTVRRLIADGELGRVHRFESRFERWRPLIKEGWRENADPAEVGGTLYDLGSHLVDQALALFGPAAEVSAEVDTRRASAGVDDDAFVAVTHVNGVRSHLWTSAITAQVGPRLRVLGDAAGYVKYGLDPQENALRAGLLPGPGWGVEPEGAWGLLGVDGAAKPVPTEPGDYPAFYRGVLGALRGEGPGPVDPRDAVATLTVLEAARRSSAEGVTVRLA